MSEFEREKVIESASSEDRNSENGLPEFLTCEYFEKILQICHNDPMLKVKKIKGQHCTNAFCSTMLRFEVDANFGRDKKQQRSYIVKMKLESEIALAALGSGSYDIYEKEMEMFHKILPEFRKILKTIGEDKNVFPKSITVDRNRDVLILEDLAVKNFVTVDREVELDVTHIQMSMAKLAKFHAASIVLMQQSPEMFENFDVGMFSRKVSAFKDKFRTNMEALTAEVSSWPGYEYYAKKLENMKSQMFERSCRAFDNDEGDLKVLVHGDLWKSNMMYVYDGEGLPKDAIILDFQFCCVAHPAIDLIFFLSTSTTDKIRQGQFLSISQFYFYQLRDALTKLQFDIEKIPTLHQFQVQMMKKLFYAFSSILLNLPLMTTTDADSNFENVLLANDQAMSFKRRLYKNKMIQEVVKSTLPTFDELGLLDDDL